MSELRERGTKGERERARGTRGPGPEAPRAESRKYAFGDSEVAARRLDLVAEVFEPPSRAFLKAFAPRNPAVALDLGCGPGHTTRLLAEVTGARRVIGVDASDAYVARATADHPDLAFVTHDATSLPLPSAPADVISCRYLLCHLDDPIDAIDEWRTQLAPGGRLLVEEPHAIDLPHPALGRYEEMVTGLIAGRGASLYPGGAIDEAGPVERRIVTHQVPVPLAARLFALNLAVWGEDPELAAELDELSRSGTGNATWHLYQAVFEAPA